MIPITAADAIAGNSIPNIGIIPPSNPKLPPKPTIKITAITARFFDLNISTLRSIIMVIPCAAIIPNR